MTKLEKRTIALNTLFNIAASLTSLFVSLYIFTYTQSIVMMCIYTFARIAMFPAFFMIGGKLSKKLPFSIIINIGLVFICAHLIYALTATSLFESNPAFVYIAALLTGMGEGLYYFASNTCYQIVPEVEHRGTFISYNGFFSNITSLLSPLLATFILSSSPDDRTAYRIILYIIIGIDILVVFVASLINKKDEQKTGLIVTRGLKLNNPKWRLSMSAVTIYGLLNGIGLNTTGLLVLQACQSSTLYSTYQTGFAIVNILSYLSLNILFKLFPKKRLQLFGAILFCLATCCLVFFNNPIGAAIYGLVGYFGQALYDSIYNLEMMKNIVSYQENQTEGVIAKEVFLSIGRCVGMLFVVLCYYIFKDYYLYISIGLCAFAPILVWKIIQKINKADD